ncbi:MAG: OmpA family protein [Treponema sp.]|jgi:flagellar hook assembly protein FlgD/flagellar motor protein MotB|nr:OmpA family protein [Treponema sp.]
MKKTLCCVAAFFCLVTALPAMDAPASPAWGADAVPDLYAPNLAGPGAFSTSTGGAPTSAINPAQGGEAQRIVFDIGYLALVGLGNEDKFGNVMEAGALFPTRYGVFGGALRLIQSPFNESFPVQTVLSGNLSAAKEIYPRMSLGAGLNFGIGSAWMWSLSGDLGIFYRVGRVGPLENFTWAAVLRGMGKSWTPSWFTPMGGVSFDVLRIHGKEGKKDPFAVNTAVDMSLPSIIYYPNAGLILKLGLRAEIAETVKLSLSWPGGSGLNTRELLNGQAFNPLPSVGLGVNINLPSGGKRIAGGRLPTDGELAVDTAYKPLYEGVTALGGGATWTVGIADKRPPVIKTGYPDPADAAYPVYFSPNNDGKADYLEFPLSITDERYVESWVWEIRDGEGNIVRTYRNKELRPETHGVRNFFGRLFAVKTQVDVPPALRWDGIGDSGELVPDGRYFFTITAADDSGNTGSTPVYEAVLKNAPPEIAVTPLDDAQRVFSPGGGGSKNTITFVPKGTAEDAWESGIYTTAGEKVRTFAVESGNPQSRVWDGKDDSGAIVGDGVYTYRIEATDRAQNYAGASMENIIVNTIRPVISVFIADPWFSPNGDGIKDTVAMNLTVPVKEEVTGWTMQIKDRQSVTVKTIRSGEEGFAKATPELLAYNGMNDSGALLAEGIYSGVLSVNYLNGYTATALSPPFNLKVTPPSAKITMDFAAFSPNNGGVQSEMIIRQEGTKEELWTGEIKRANAPAAERPVRSFRFNGTPLRELRWDGSGESGTFAADGEYTYELYAIDQAGNAGRSNTLRFRMSTVDTPVMITTDLRAFSPNGDGVKDAINLNPQIQVKEGIVSYRVEVQDNAGRAVRTFEGQGMPPAAISWNGRTTANTPAPEGQYKARLELRYEQGNQPSAVSLPFELDITPPKGSVSAPYTAFSPNGKRAVIPFNVKTEADDEWEAVITGAGGRRVKTWNWKGAAPEIVWDGKDAAGNAAPDGTYQLSLESTDLAGNSARYNVPGLSLDARIPRLILTSSSTGIAPRANQNTDLVRFGVICSLQEGIESWSLELKDDKGSVMRRFASPPLTVPSSIGWNGLSEGGGIREGRFTPTLTVNYLKGDVATAETASILVHVSGPELSINYRPQYFSPDNDGVDDELFIRLGAKSPAPVASWYLEIREPVPPHLLFYRIEGKGSPAETVIWDGRSNKGELVQAATDYPVKYSATDILGNSSVMDSQIGVDVLVIRDGNRLKIQVPSIVFRENAADFNGIPTDRSDNNVRVLRRIADILNKFRDYKVQVEGHANPVQRTEREERSELQPLSESRAQTVVNMLIEFGVARGRLSATGMGGSKPVVQYEDRDNWWKNRRVEFILIK